MKEKDTVTVIASQEVKVSRKKFDDDLIAFKKKNLASSSTTSPASSSSSAAMKHGKANRGVDHRLSMMDDGVSGIGISSGWAQPPQSGFTHSMFTPDIASLSTERMDTFNLGVQSIGSSSSSSSSSSSTTGTYGDTNGKFRHSNHNSNEVSPVIGSSQTSMLSMNAIGTSPLRRSQLEGNMPPLNLSPEPMIGVNSSSNNNNSSSSSSSSVGSGGLDSSSLFGNSTSFGGLGSTFGSTTSNRSMFSAPERTGSQESDLNVDSFFADLSSSIAASLDLDIVDPMLEDIPGGGSRRASQSRLLNQIPNTSSSTDKNGHHLPPFTSRLVGSLGVGGGVGVGGPPIISMMDSTQMSPEQSSISSPTMSGSRLSHYIKAQDSLNSSVNSTSLGSVSHNNSIDNTIHTGTVNNAVVSGGVGIVGGVPDYHKDAVELDFFEQSKSFFGSANVGMLDDEGLEDEGDYLQGGGDEDNWE
jgi:hypothetical protein